MKHSQHLIKFSILLLLSSMLAGSLSCDKAPVRKSFALVNGEAIFEDEVMDEALVHQIRQLEAQILQLKVQRTEEVIQQRLLRQQSKRLGMTEVEILKPFDSLKSAPISPEEMERVRQHLGRFEDSAGATDQKNQQSWNKVMDDIRGGRVIEARRRFLSELRARATVKNLLTEPGSEDRHNPPD